MISAMNTFTDWKHITEKLDISLTTDTGGMVLRDSNCDIVAAAVFDGWLHNTVNMHMMTTNMRAVVRSGFLDEVFDYVFTTAGRKKALGMIAASNKKSVRLAKRFGFAEKTRIVDGFADGDDLIILELKRENCPYWAGVPHGTESTKAA